MCDYDNKYTESNGNNFLSCLFIQLHWTATGFFFCPNVNFEGFYFPGFRMQISLNFSLDNFHCGLTIRNFHIQIDDSYYFL